MLRALWAAALPPAVAAAAAAERVLCTRPQELCRSQPAITMEHDWWGVSETLSELIQSWRIRGTSEADAPQLLLNALAFSSGMRRRGPQLVLPPDASVQSALCR